METEELEETEDRLGGQRNDWRYWSDIGEIGEIEDIQGRQRRDW